MPRLVASDLSDRSLVRRQWPLEEGIVLPLGSRVPADQIKVDWDDQVAPRHAVIEWRQERLRVDRCNDPAGATSVFYAGCEADSFEVMPGEGFVIGRTVFRLDPAEWAQSSGSRESADGAHFYSADMLHTMSFNPTEEQLKAIHELVKPDRAELDDFAKRLVDTIRAVIRPQYAAVLKIRSEAGRVEVLTESDSRPGICESLVLEACRQQQAAEYCWNPQRKSPPKYPPVGKMTGWVFCVPVLSSKEVDGDLAIYVSGRHYDSKNGQDRALSDDHRVFLNIVGEILSGVQTVDVLKRDLRWMQEFFPKPIRNLLQRQKPDDVFHQEQAQAAVLFCDLRGSCRLAEQGSGNMLASWNRLSAALSVMTEAITNQYGTIGDFQGDAAMGFWGWPRVDSSTDSLKDSVKSACQAADMLRERFRQKSRAKGPLEGFACGMGIASGSVVAGMLGTEDQRKISVFGPIVNLAARLESMTKQFGASIIIDEATKSSLIECDKTWSSRVRWLGKVLPLGMSQSVSIFELMPSEADPDRLPLKKLKRYEEGQREFDQGNWTQAITILDPLANQDGPARFLFEYMKKHRAPPSDWDGTIFLDKK